MCCGCFAHPRVGTGIIMSFHASSKLMP
jgi:hypothetical protein